MIMNIRGHKGEEGRHPPQEVQLPASSQESSILNPHAIEAMANELYAAVPGLSSVATQVNQAESAVEVTTPTVPQLESERDGVAAVTAGEHPAARDDLSAGVFDDALSAIAQQLYAQMSPTSLDPAMEQAIAGLKPAALAPETAPGFPATSVPGEALGEEALNQLAQQLSAQIPRVFPNGSPGQPTPTFPLSEASPVGETEQPDFSFLSTPGVENLGLESGEPFDVQVVRKDFPILHQQVHGKPLIWMDNAATAQKPQSVIDTVSRFYEQDNSNIHRGAHTLSARATDAYEDAREKVQRFLGASSASEIIFTRGTTEAINLVAQTYGRKYVRVGDEIVLSTLEHHSNIVPWQMLAQETGAILKVIPVSDSGEILLEEYARLLGPRTRIVALTHVSNAIGTILPVQEMTEMAHRYGARVLIDGAQAVPHFPVNVQAGGCDFYTFSGHKLFGPMGIGVLYGKREILEDMPPWQGGGGMIRNVTFEETTYENPPAKFEAGTPSVADAIGLGAAIDYITRLGMSNIEQYERQLTEYATERLAQIPGLRLIGTAPHKVGVLSFLLDDIPPEEVGKRLDQEGIEVRAGHHCAQPTMQRYGVPGTVRSSLAFYNTREEIDTLVEVLRTIRYR